MGTLIGGEGYKRRSYRGQIPVGGQQTTIAGLPEISSEIIDRGFISYVVDIKPNKEEIINIKYNKDLIESVLKEKIIIDDIHVFGSYARRTLIEDHDGNDVDIMFVLNPIYKDWLEQTNGPSNCLLYLKKILSDNPILENADISIDKNAVKVKFKNIKFDVVPGFKDPEDGYRIPNTSGIQSWVQTNPRMFKNILEASNKYNNGRVIELIRIVKGWNINNGRILNSFHIENLVYHHFKLKEKKYSASLFDEIVDFYYRLPLFLQNPTKEPVYGEKIDSYLDINRLRAIEVSLKTYNNIIQSEKSVKNGQTELANQKLKRMFGNKFDIQ